MKSKRERLTAVILASAVLVTVAAGCAKKETLTPTRPAATVSNAPIRAAMVTDVGRIGDRGFNDLSYAGLQRAAQELGAEIRVLQSREPADYEGNLSQLGAAGYNLVFAVGYLMTDTVTRCAPRFAGTTFAGIDMVFDPVAANIIGLSFKEQEAGYLAGVLAGRLTTRTDVDARINAEKIVGFIGGMDIPPIRRFEAGFIAGVTSAAPDVNVRSVYTGSLTDPEKGHAAAQGLIEGGADIVFAAAGAAGNAAAQACQDNRALFIGVDADQHETITGIGDTILTSAMKRVDNAVFLTVKDAADGKMKGGVNRVFGLAEDGVGLAPYHDWDAKLPQDIKDAVARAKADIVAGTVTVPETKAGQPRPE